MRCLWLQPHPSQIILSRPHPFLAIGCVAACVASREGNRKAIIGLILVKELVLINPGDNTTVSALRLRELPRLAADTPM